MAAEVAIAEPTHTSDVEAEEGRKAPPEPEQNGGEIKPEEDNGKPQSEQNGGAPESGQNGSVPDPEKDCGKPEVGQNGGEPEPEAEGGGHEEDDLDDIREGETAEKALQRRIEEGKIGKGRNVRKWKDTEEKQRRVESGRYQSKVRRYGKIYEEVRALRQETRHSVQDLRERFKDKGVIQNKDQFIVRLIAQERTEQEGKVAAIKSLQQWRLTDIELHNFLNRCHKRGLAGKLELAKQWVFEQAAAGGEVTFKEGLAFYSSIGILQPRSSAQTQQQWREWREWEDAMTAALEEQKGRKVGGASEDGAGSAAPDVCNEDSTVCSSPWSSERGGSGSFGCSNGNFRSSSAHGEGDVAGGYGSARYRSGSGTAPEVPKENLRVAVGRGRTPSDQGSPRQKDWWSWRSCSPPSISNRPRSLEGASRLPLEKRAAAFGPVANGKVEGGNIRHMLSPVPPLPMIETPEGSETSSKAAEAVVRASGGYLPPRHRLAALQLSPSRPADRSTLDRAPSSTTDPGEASRTSSGDSDAPESASGANAAKVEESLAILEASVESGAGRTRNSDPTFNHSRGRVGVRARGAARTRAKGPAGGGTPTLSFDLDEGPAPTEELGIGNGGGSDSRWRQGNTHASRDEKSRSLSGVISGLADWFVPGMDRAKGRRSTPDSKELLVEVYPTAPGTPPSRGETKSAPATPCGRRKASSVLRGGGWFYNGDSDYSSSDEGGSHDSEDEGFWADAGTTEPPRHLGGGGGESILDRLRRLFT